MKPAADDVVTDALVVAVVPSHSAAVGMGWPVALDTAAVYHRVGDPVLPLEFAWLAVDCGPAYDMP